MSLAVVLGLGCTMDKRPSVTPARPRSRMSFPGYPTLAAAGLYLCLSAGCGSGTSEPESPPVGGSAPTTFDARPPDTQSTPPLAGGMALPFDALPADAEAVPSPDTRPADASPDPGYGPLSGSAPPPY